MKKLLLLTLFWFTVAVGVAQAQPPRCVPSQDTLDKYKGSGSTPSQQWRGVNGFYPNPSPLFCVGQYGETVVQVILPYDTTVGPLTARFITFRLDSITQIPAGLQFQTNSTQSPPVFTPANQTQPAIACATIYGTPTTANAVSDSVTLHVFATAQAGIISQSGTARVKYRVRVGPAGSSGCVTSSIADLVEVGSLSLYPNPTVNSARLTYELKKLANIHIEVLDMAGRAILTRQLDSQMPGSHELELNTTTLPEGIYLVKFAIGNEILVRKLLKAAN